MRLHVSQAKKIAEAERAYSAAKQAYEDAKTEREEVRERYADRVPLGESVRAGAFEITRREHRNGPSFSIAGFLEKHKLTKTMHPFYDEGGSHERWSVKERQG